MALTSNVLIDSLCLCVLPEQKTLLDNSITRVRDDLMFSGFLPAQKPGLENQRVPGLHSLLFSVAPAIGNHSLP